MTELDTSFLCSYMSLINLIVFFVMLQIQDYFAARMISGKTLERNRVMQKRIGDEVPYEYSLLNRLFFKLFSVVRFLRRHYLALTVSSRLQF